MSAIERAAELGTEHGVKAAEAAAATIRWGLAHGVREEVALPAPDLTGDHFASPLDLPGERRRYECRVCGLPIQAVNRTLTAFRHLPGARDAYSTAFTAAVETTIREAVQS